MVDVVFSTEEVFVGVAQHVFGVLLGVYVEIMVIARHHPQRGQ